MSLVSHTIRSWPRSWGRIGATVATFALAAAVSLSLAPAAGAAERFGSPVQISGLTGLNALTLGDFRGTGREDIAAISSSGVFWLQGEGGGAFASPVESLVGLSARLSDIATLPNTDGADYAAIADEADQAIDIGSLSPNGFVRVQQLSLASIGCTPLEIAVLDLGGEPGGSDSFAVRCAPLNTSTTDANSEIAVVAAAPPATPGGRPTWSVSQVLSGLPGLLTNIATILDNAAGGVDIVAILRSPNAAPVSQVLLVTFLPTTVLGHFVPSGQNPMLGQTLPDALATATIDGSPALIVGSFGEPNFPPLVDYLSNGNGTYAGGLTLPISIGLERPTALAAGLFNGNSITDVAVAESLSTGCVVTIDTGEGPSVLGTPVFAAGITPATCVSVTGMKVGDLNGAGRDDIAYVDPDNGLFVLYQDPPEIFTVVPVTVVATLPVASEVGLLIQRRGKSRRVEVEVQTPTGTDRVTREVPTFIKVGRIPLGPHHKGRNTIHYKLLVNGHPLAPGNYIVTLRSLNAKGQVLDLSQPVALTVDHHGHAHFGKHVLV